ncbi:MAG: sensor histidine kinase [Acidobacteriota bacterium]|nr:sensor histidine kinase [Acidobacteriota bacterium]
MTQPSPTIRLYAGLAVTLLAVGIYSGYTIHQIRGLETLQTETIDRSRTDTLLLLRIQNGLNSLALTMRDMLDEREPYPLSAWAPQFRRIRDDLEDALSREDKLALVVRSDSQRRYLADSFRQFWNSLDRLLALAAAGNEAEARTQIRLSLQARHAALSTAVSRLLIQNNESEQAAAERTRELYTGAERNVYIFLAAMIVVIVLTTLLIASYNRRLFRRVADLSERRGELAQQLIAVQETTFRSISRDLHDDFGQILTAIGAMLRSPRPEALNEVREIVQETLDKVRALSHALHPVVLDEAGIESALDAWLPVFQRQTGVAIDYRKEGDPVELDRETATHVYRIAQEALNNVAKHSGAHEAAVLLRFAADTLTLEVRDRGRGMGAPDKTGLGMVSMRERAEMMRAKLEIQDHDGVTVKLTVPCGVAAHA